MASMRDIKRRKQSVESTQQITKAMKLVATVKLQRAKQRAEQSKYFFDAIYSTVSSILRRSGTINHRYLNAPTTDKKAVIMLTGNRGLAGGYNSNVIKLITKNEKFTTDNTVVYAAGKKGKDSLQRLGYTIGGDYSDAIDEPTYPDAMKISREVLTAFENGEIGEIYLAYTFFKNTVTHEQRLIKLLPVEIEVPDLPEGTTETTIGDSDSEDMTPMNFEPEDVEALDMIIPKYMTSLIHGALIEAVASENGARMQAMDNATTNATELIDKLSLLYNRARQGAITQELTEIIAGADAIS
ncbi:MAG: ATP synthase F1 subunit gamma [Lachnospiraceae bacterium]|nr:ATP synthase F1 subunit gamma [Lachnospiraceae bacterium]